MIIRSARFVGSNLFLNRCPPAFLPEFAFIGRSNVGKSSLINMLTGVRKLAKTSAEPGKTRTINHFLINDSWYLVDLPGYGYAKTSAWKREQWSKAAKEYILKRETLVYLFILIDPRHKPQKSDIEFIEFLEKNLIPFTRIFTKTDKISRTNLDKSIREYNAIMLKNRETLPVSFISSTVTKEGRMDILDFIEESLNNFSKQG